MSKALLTCIFVALTAIPTYAQGTIAFGNGALTRIAVTLPGTTSRNATAADNLIVGAFYGPAGVTDPAALRLALPTASIGTTAGIMINAPSVFQLPGTNPGEVVSLQIRAWNAAGWYSLET
jgi:hypothetical protein